ncbi:MAG: hypothetical protein QXZ12_06860 [Thermoplasmata archaeon]
MEESMDEQKSIKLIIGIKIKGFFSKEYDISVGDSKDFGILNFRYGDYLTYFDANEDSVLRIIIDEFKFLIIVKDGLFNFECPEGKVIVSIHSIQ